MKYGYARVSSKKQLIKGNSLEEQVNRLKEEGCQEIVSEQYTGTKTDRPKFSALLEKLQAGDTLVVTKLDRFARNISEGSKLIKDLLEKDIRVHVLNIGLIENTSTGRLIFNILMSFAEFERDMIVERTQAGLEIARTKEGFRMGRPPIFKEKVEGAMLLLKTHSYTKVEKMTGISKSSLVRYRRKYKEKEITDKILDSDKS